ncbi:MAG TPA: tetratricopeptide repeat protein [Methanocellaceae archaeon]
MDGSVMDAEKSLKIARKRFQNGNYLLSAKKYGAARKELEVALSLYEKTDADKEQAETLNNIGITLVKEGRAGEAKDYFERSYELKKDFENAKESRFNTLYNILGVGASLSVEEFERYFLSMKALGTELGGEYADIVAKEQAVYDRFAELREKEIRRQEEEELAKISPSGALEHLIRLGKPCVVRVKFDLHEFSLSSGEYSYMSGGKPVKLFGIEPAIPATGDPVSSGEMEFDATYESARRLIDGVKTPDLDPMDIPLLEESFEHMKRFLEAVALVREDINYCLNKHAYSVVSVSLKNGFGDMIEVYRAEPATLALPTVLTSEDAMMISMMLSSNGQKLYKMLLLNAKRLLSEENYALCVVDAIAGFESFLDILLKKALSETDARSYLAISEPGLGDRLSYLKKLVSGVQGQDGSLEPYLGDVGKDLDSALKCYAAIMSNSERDIMSYEAGKTLKSVNRAIYNLKSLYDV